MTTSPLTPRSRDLAVPAAAGVPRPSSAPSSAPSYDEEHRGARVAAWARAARPVVVEAGLMVVLYVAYSLARSLASDDLAPAVGHARAVLHLEQLLHLDLEHPLNDLLASSHLLSVGASFYYASAHYLVTPVVLVWLFWRRRDAYRPARRTLALATLIALGVYILLPTAPPRLVGGYHDVLAATAGVGWWSTSASAPQRLGHLTDQLAAMPSMHVGWALWCALVLHTQARTRWARGFGWTHVAVTSLVVVGTGNHWLLDVVAGAALVLVAWTALVGPVLGVPVCRHRSDGAGRTHSSSSAPPSARGGHRVTSPRAGLTDLGGLTLLEGPGDVREQQLPVREGPRLGRGDGSSRRDREE